MLVKDEIIPLIIFLKCQSPKPRTTDRDSCKNKRDADAVKSPKRGKQKTCMSMARINPEPTSMMLSIRLFMRGPVVDNVESLLKEEKPWFCYRDRSF